MILRPSPTQAKFVASTAFLDVLMGPRGEGKTSAAVIRLLYRSKKMRLEHLPLRCAVVRDTWTNLLRTTVKSLRDLQAQGLPVDWVGGEQEPKEAIVGRGRIHLFFIGMDRAEDANKWQSFEIGALWIEEPAPAADLSGGVAPEVLGLGVTSLRQAGVEPFVMVTMNPPDEDHWILTIKDSLAAIAAKRPDVPVKVGFWTIPKGENPHITLDYRERNRAVLEAMGRGDLVARLVEGRIGQIILGEPVTPEYSETIHLAPDALSFLPRRPVVRCWDPSGGYPTCAWTQVTPMGHWNILGAVVGENITLEDLIETQIKPWQGFYLGDPDDWEFRDIVDPDAFHEKEKARSNTSAVQVMVELLRASPEPGPVEWAARLNSLKGVLGRHIRGRGVVQVDPECKIVRRTLRGGAHYPKDALGRIVPTLEAMKRASGIHAHPFMALCYGAGRLFPAPRVLERSPRRRPSGKPAGLGWMGA